jgi:hypothetical protein
MIATDIDIVLERTLNGQGFALIDPIQVYNRARRLQADPAREAAAPS